MAETKLAANSTEGKAKSFVERIERLDMSIQALKDTIKDDLKSYQEDKREIMAEAKAQGVPPKVVKAQVRARAAERKLKETLTIDEMALYQTLKDTMGELGAAAAKAKGYA
jgi:uncharacterized protein (UPF0335 family)